MRHQQGETLTDLERDALANGLARFYRGRLIPVMRGGTDDADQGGAGDGSGDGSGNGVTAGTGTAVAPRTFTQDDVDRIVQDRLARARNTPPADYEELKARAAQLDEIEQQSKTDLQKAQERAAELERENAATTARANDALLRASVIAEAARRNVVDPDAAFALIDRDSLTLDGEGRPTNIADAMDSLLKAKPYLVGGGRAGNADLGARTRSDGPSQLTHADLKNMTPEQIVKADEEGRLNDLKQAT